jgi:hypothetical protein
MPNGGSDCCGTCWFNRKNRGEASSRHSSDAGEAFCEIRGLGIEDPFWTYCANHPHRSRERDRIRIGPVQIDPDGEGRRIWKGSPDSEEIRAHLLALLAAIDERPAVEYPIGIYRDEVVIWQLGEFREARALSDLRRIAGFDAAAQTGPFGRTRDALTKLAREALAKISGHEEPR